MRGAVSPVGEYQWNHQGRFGEAYFRALATAAGASVAQLSGGDDLVGIDFMLSLPREIRGLGYPKIEVQVKTASAPQMSADGTLWKFRGLDERQFNDLAGDRFQVPRYLVMLRVPNSRADYACVTPNALELRHVGYWCSLVAEPVIADPSTQRKVLVEIPVANLLTVESLLSLFEPRPGDVSMPATQLQTGGTS